MTAVLRNLVLITILLNSNNSLANICTALLDNGIRDNFSTITKSSKFNIYKRALCDEKHTSYSSYSSAIKNQSLNLEYSDIIVGLTGDSNTKKNKFQESYSKFCVASYESSNYKNAFNSYSSVINTDLAAAFNICVGTVSAYKAKRNLDVYIDVTPQADNSNFTVRVDRASAAETLLTDISPVTVACTKSGKPVKVPLKVDDKRFTLDCRKDNNTAVSLQITTKGEGFSNTVNVPDQRDRLQNIEQDIYDLRYELGILSPQTVIIAVASDACPVGWKDYEKGYGQFIRGIDKSNKKIDPDGRRNHGTLQTDLIKKHKHPYSSSARKDVSAKGSKSDFAWNKQSYTTSENTDGGSETRPKNIALLFCQRK